MGLTGCQHDLSAACWALGIVLHKAAQALLVEHVATAQLLGELHVFKADNACRVDSPAVLFNGEVDVRHEVELHDQLPELDEELNGLVELLRRVNELSDEVYREVASDENIVAQLEVEQQN